MRGHGDHVHAHDGLDARVVLGEQQVTHVEHAEKAAMLVDDVRVTLRVLGGRDRLQARDHVAHVRVLGEGDDVGAHDLARAVVGIGEAFLELATAFRCERGEQDATRLIGQRAESVGRIIGFGQAKQGSRRLRDQVLIDRGLRLRVHSREQARGRL